MKPKDLEKWAAAAELRAASAAALGNGGSDHGGHHHHGGASAGNHGANSSERAAEYRGHTIRIVTTYEVAIDGKSVAIPFHVDDEGHVTCHAVPAYTSTTALDVARRIIDSYPHRYPAARATKRAGAKKRRKR